MRKEVCSVFFINLNLFTSFHEDLQRGMEIELNTNTIFTAKGNHIRSI